MDSRKVFWSGLIIIGLVGVLCPYGLAAGQAADANRPATAQPGQPTMPPGTAPQGQPAPGTAPQPSMTPSPTTPGGMPMMLVRTSQLIGKDVKSTSGESLGVIHDVVLTPDYQGVSYVALSYGGVFGVGKKLYAIPWQALRVSPTGEATLTATKDQFSSATSFSNNNWPSQGDTRWLSAGAAGAAPTAPPMGARGAGTATNREIQMRRVTHLTGTEVNNPENQDLGDIEDFVINAPDGRIVYDIISFGGVAGAGEKYAAVPANAIRLQPQAHVAVLNTTRQTLDSVAFNPGEYPNLSSPEYMQRLTKLFAAAPAGGALGYVPGQAPQAQDAAGDERAWGAGGPHGKNFNPSTVKTVTGMVENVGGFKPEGAPAGVSPGLRLRVRTAEGKIVTVYAGPASYAEQKDFYIMPGDRISITGSETKIRSRTVILASELKKDAQTLQLRDQSGKPLWTMRAAPQGTMTRPGSTRSTEK